MAGLRIAGGWFGIDTMKGSARSIGQCEGACRDRLWKVGMISTVQLEAALAAGEGKGIGENEDDKVIEGDSRMGKKARMYP